MHDAAVGDPSVFIDMFGREVGWYLPEILTPAREVCASPYELHCLCMLIPPSRRRPSAPREGYNL